MTNPDTINSFDTKKIASELCDVFFKSAKFSTLGGWDIQREEYENLIVYYYAKHKQQLHANLEADVANYLSGGKQVWLIVELNNTNNFNDAKLIFDYLFKEKPSQFLLDKIVACLLDSQTQNNEHTIFEHCSKDLDLQYSKQIVLQKLSDFEYKDKKYDSNLWSHHIVLAFNSLKAFDFEPSEYSELKKMMDFYKEIFKRPDPQANNTYMTCKTQAQEIEEALVSFIKEKIDINYWHEFAHYPREKGFFKVENARSLFEEDGFYSLTINHDAVRCQYPRLASQADITALMSAFITVFKEQKFGAPQIHDFSSEDETCLHFKGKDINKNLIQSVFKQLLQMSYEEHIARGNPSREYIEKSFQVCMLEHLLASKPKNKLVAKI